MGKQKRSWKRWTEEEDFRLYRLMKTGKYTHEIADEMDNRTESSVSNRIYNKQSLRDSYREFSPRRSMRGRRRRILTVTPAPSGPEKKEVNPTVEEICSIADDNRIWLTLTSASIAAFCAMVVLIIFAGVMLL